MNRTQRLLTAVTVIFGVFALTNAAIAGPKGKHHHKDGQQQVGEKIKSNGKHVIEKKGPHTISVEVKDGKIAGLHVKHAKKGALPVKKYKTTTKMVQKSGYQYASFNVAQAQYMGTVYIGYAYYDDYGDEQIYWFPYDMILDGDTGAIEYVPVY